MSKTLRTLQGYLVFGFSDIFFTGQYALLSVGVSVAKSDMVVRIADDADCAEGRGFLSLRIGHPAS